MKPRSTSLPLALLLPLLVPFGPRAARAQVPSAPPSRGIPARTESAQVAQLDAEIRKYDAIIALEPPLVNSFTAYARRAELQLKRHHPKEALADAKTAIELAPKVADAKGMTNLDFKATLGMALRVRAFADMEANTGLDAIRDFDAALELDPKDGAALVGRALAKSDMRNRSWKDDVAAALTLNPRSAAALTARGDGVLNEGFHFQADDATRAAMLDYNAAIAADPNFAPAYFGRAELIFRLAKTPDERTPGFADLDRAIELDPTFILYYERRASSKSGQRPAEALADYGRIIALDADNPERYLNRARFQAGQPQPDDTQLLSDYNRAIELSRAEIQNFKGSNPYALISKRFALGQGYIGRGELLLRQSKLQDAISDFNTALKLSPKNINAVAGRARILVRAKRPELALSELNAAMPGAREIKVLGALKKGVAARGAVFIALKQWQDAIVDLNAAIKDDSIFIMDVSKPSQDAELYFNRGMAFSNLGQKDKALDDFNIAVKLAPRYRQRIAPSMQEKLTPRDPDKSVVVDTSDTPTAHKLLGNEWHAVENNDKAMAEYSKAIELDANYPDAYNNRAALYKVARKPIEALSDYNKAIELAPQDARFRYNRGIFLIDGSRTAEGVADLEKAATLDPQNRDIFLALGRARETAGNLAEAETFFATALTLSQTPEDKHVPQVRLVLVRAFQNKAPTAEETTVILDASKNELKAIQQMCAAQLTKTPNVPALVNLNQSIEAKLKAA